MGLELCEEGSLQSLIKQGPVPEPQARKITKGILSGLHYLHQENLIHRDIKPANVLLSKG